jgi:hypothetical protein
VTSNGVDPETNFDAAMRGWDLYQEHGRFMAYDPSRASEFADKPGKVEKGTGLTFRANSYKGAMKLLDRLVQEKGEAGAVEWLKSKQTIAELKKYDPDITVGDGSPRYGSYVLGEKVSVRANLNGIYTELTRINGVANVEPLDGPVHAARQQRGQVQVRQRNGRAAYPG